MPSLLEFANLFTEASVSSYFERTFGRKPVFIFDNVNILKNSPLALLQLLSFGKASMSSSAYRVIICGSEGWAPAYISVVFDNNRIRSIQMISEFTAQESYSFHKCLRPGDSDKIISDTYYFLKAILSNIETLHHMLMKSKVHYQKLISLLLWKS